MNLGTKVSSELCFVLLYGRTKHSSEETEKGFSLCSYPQREHQVAAKKPITTDLIFLAYESLRSA